MDFNSLSDALQQQISLLNYRLFSKNNFFAFGSLNSTVEGVERFLGLLLPIYSSQKASLHSDNGIFKLTLP